MTHTVSNSPLPGQLGKHAEFASLGSRLVRFGQALQDDTTTVAQLTKLASACGITLKLRAVAESGEPSNE